MVKLSLTHSIHCHLQINSPYLFLHFELKLNHKYLFLLHLHSNFHSHTSTSISLCGFGYLQCTFKARAETQPYPHLLRQQSPIAQARKYNCTSIISYPFYQPLLYHRASRYHLPKSLLWLLQNRVRAPQASGSPWLQSPAPCPSHMSPTSYLMRTKKSIGGTSAIPRPPPHRICTSHLAMPTTSSLSQNSWIRAPLALSTLKPSSTPTDNFWENPLSLRAPLLCPVS